PVPEPGAVAAGSPTHARPPTRPDASPTPDRGNGGGVRCLVTNDDGIDSEGLRVLALAAVEAGLEVVVAAPMMECSGASASLSAVEEDGRVVVEPRRLPGLAGAGAVLAVAGLPAFVALTAMGGAFGPPPDIVL